MPPEESRGAGEGRVLITGSSGRIGSVLHAGLEAAGLELRLFDKEEPESNVSRDDAVELVSGDLTDIDAVVVATRDVGCVVHLGGIPEEAGFDELLDANIRGTYNVFEAARINQVPRVIFASTNHVIGYYPSDRLVDEVMPPRPDTLYAVSKVYGEALGRMYHDKHGLEVISVRIGSFRPEPGSRRELATWLSHDDTVRLFLACIVAKDVRHHVVYGVSRNEGSRWKDSDGRTLGFVPRDSADAYVDRGLEASEEDRFHGGAYTRPDHLGGF